MINFVGGIARGGKKALLGYFLKPLWKFMEGRKTVTGAISLLLWILMYGLPAVKPEWSFLVSVGAELRSLLESLNVSLDQELLSAGVGLTVVGLIDKMRRMVSEWIAKRLAL